MQSRTRTSGLSLAAHTFAHFCVDFACFYQLFAGLARTSAHLETVATGFMAYNVIAFGLQPVIGYASDRKRTFPMATAGCLMVLGGLFLLPLVWPSLLLCALGNACFHVGGGSESLVNAGGKMARSGIFVSSGALGVVLGTLLGKSTAPVGSGATLLPGWPVAHSALIPAVLLVVSTLAILRTNPRPSVPRRSMKMAPLQQSGMQPAALDASPFRTASVRRPFEAVMLLCLVSITIRSYIGSIVPIDWRTSTLLMLLPAAGAMLGKAAGGLLADWLGARRVGVVSLMASLPFLVLGSASPLACVLGIVLFNISMSITLCAVYDLLPGFPGLSFGLTTLALLVGNLPTFFLAIPRTLNPLVVSVLILASAGCLHLAIRNQHPQTQSRADFNGGASDENPIQEKAPEAL